MRAVLFVPTDHGPMHLGALSSPLLLGRPVTASTSKPLAKLPPEPHPAQAASEALRWETPGRTVFRAPSSSSAPFLFFFLQKSSMFNDF